MADPNIYQQQVQQPDPSAYGQPQQQMFDPNAAAAYGYAIPPQQQVVDTHHIKFYAKNANLSSIDVPSARTSAAGT
jgi:hypothetical protein